MTWSYTGDLINNPIDKIRFTLGDTNELAPLFQDEELQSVLTLSNDSTNAAIRKCFLQLLARFARDVDYTIGPEKVAAGYRFNHYKQLFADFNKGLNSIYAYPLGEGVTTPPTDSIFDIGMHDNKGQVDG